MTISVDYEKIADEIYDFDKLKEDRSDKIINLRLEVLKLAFESLKISNDKFQKDFERNIPRDKDFDFKKDLFVDIDVLHEVADYHLKYILGGE